MTAAERTETAIRRYARVATFHPAEADTAYLTLADALVMLEDSGVEAVADHTPAGDVERAVWKACADFARRAMAVTRTPAVNAYFTPVHADDCDCNRCY